jgi:hypothetical protein
MAEALSGCRPPGWKIDAEDQAGCSLSEQVLGAEAELEDSDDVPVVVHERRAAFSFRSEEAYGKHRNAC